MLNTSLLLAHALEDRHALRRLVASASHDVIMGDWEARKLTDAYERARTALLAEDASEMTRSDLIAVARDTLDAAMRGDLSHASRTIGTVRELVAETSGERWAEANEIDAMAAMRALAATGVRSALLDAMLACMPRDMIGEIDTHPMVSK